MEDWVFLKLNSCMIHHMLLEEQCYAHINLKIIIWNMWVSPGCESGVLFVHFSAIILQLCYSLMIMKSLIILNKVSWLFHCKNDTVYANQWFWFRPEKLCQDIQCLKRTTFAYYKRCTVEAALSAPRLVLPLHVFRTEATGQPCVNMCTAMVGIATDKQ